MSKKKDDRGALSTLGSIATELAVLTSHSFRKAQTSVREQGELIEKLASSILHLSSAVVNIIKRLDEHERVLNQLIKMNSVQSRLLREQSSDITLPDINDDAKKKKVDKPN